MPKDPFDPAFSICWMDNCDAVLFADDNITGITLTCRPGVVVS